MRAEFIAVFETGPSESRTGGRMMHDIKLHLDNGAVVTFTVEEHPTGGEYGVHPCYHPAPKKRTR